MGVPEHRLVRELGFARRKYKQSPAPLPHLVEMLDLMKQLLKQEFYSGPPPEVQGIMARLRAVAGQSAPAREERKPDKEGSPSRNTLDALRKQVEYYFGAKNYSKDAFLRAQEDAEGFVSLRFVCSFNRLVSLSRDLERDRRVAIVRRALRSSAVVELSADGSRLRCRRAEVPAASRDAHVEHGGRQEPVGSSGTTDEASAGIAKLSLTQRRPDLPNLHEQTASAPTMMVAGWNQRRDGRRPGPNWNDPTEDEIFAEAKPQPEETEAVVVQIAGLGEADAAPVQHFSQAPLSDPLKENLERSGYNRVPSVPAHLLPVALSGRSMLICGAVPRGKKITMLVPGLQALLRSGPPTPTGDDPVARRKPSPCALILVPSCRLAEQLHGEALMLAWSTGIRCAMACDEFHLRENVHWLRDGVDVLIGQPKRVWQLHSNGLLSLAQVQHLVLDAHSGPANEAFRSWSRPKTRRDSSLCSPRRSLLTR